MEEKKVSLRAGSSDQKSSGEAQSIISVINDVDSGDEKVDEKILMLCQAEMVQAESDRRM